MRTKQLWCFLTAVLVLLLFSFASYGAGRPFITRWKGEAGRKLRIPINEFNDSYVGYKIVIKKASDGSVLVTKNILYNSSFIYTPTEDGELLVEAGPNGVTSFRTSDDNAECLLRVEQFGTVKWTSISFRGSENLQFAEGIDTPDLSKVTNMDDMFSGCTSFNQPLNSWDVSKVTSMGSMFSGCTSFNQPLNSWDVSKVTSMRSMFSGCTSFNQPLNNWDVSQVTDMGGMFSNCTSFNQNLEMWKLESCNQLGLDNCGMSVENYSKSLVGWAAQANIMQSYLNLSARGLKYNAGGKTARTKLILEKEWRFIGDIDERAQPQPFITRWKGEAGKELRIPIQGQNYKLVIKKASDGRVLVTENDLYGTYSYTPTENCELLVEAGPEGVNSIEMWNKDEGVSSSADALLRVEQFGTVQWQTMRDAFLGCSNLQFAEDIDTPDLFSVGDMSGMFAGCSSFNQSLSSWNVSRVTSMRGMFSCCTSFNQPLNNWDVSKVFSMENMFFGCTSFNQDLGMWKLESCNQLGLDDCGMSAENYSKSLIGWAAQGDIHSDLQLGAEGLKYFLEATTARNTLIRSKHWTISGDMLLALTFGTKKISLIKGVEHMLELTKEGIDKSETVTIASSDPTIVQIVDVASSIKIKGIRGGTATITATVAANGSHGELIDKCEVTVIVPVTGVTLSQTELPLVKGASAELTATVSPADATNKNVTWSSNNKTVATVENGTVTAVSGGHATITVTTEDGNHTASCEVFVTVPITGVTLSQTELPLVKGASAELTASVSPADATNKNVTWSSNNSSVATVENGTVTAVSVGNATITVTTEDGNYTASCSVTVEAATAVADAVFASVHVSPNPFGAQLRIANGDLRGQYALYNAQGVVVASGVLEDGETRINTASFSAGVYLLRLTAENGAAKTLTVVKD